MLLGVGVGVVLGPSGEPVEPAIAVLIGNWLALPGKLFLALIQMVVVPLVFASIIRGLAASENMDQLRKMGTVVLLYFVAYLVIVFLAAGKKPLAFISAVRDVLLLAFSTSSSAAVMPLSIKTAEEKLGVSSSVAQFVIPVGATLNMNGTALYQGVATIFLAQVFGIDIGFSGLLLVVVMAVGASIGSPATPGVGIVILAMVLGSVGVPVEGFALIIGVDRILDMARTAVNVSGNIVASVLMDRWIGETKSSAEASSIDAATVRLEPETGETVLINPEVR